MKRYKLEEIKVGMKVYVDELHNIEGVYIILANPEVVMTEDGTKTQGTIKKISKKRLYVRQPGEAIYFRRKGYSEFFE